MGSVIPTGGNGDETEKFAYFPIWNVGALELEVGFVFFGEDVAVYTWTDYFVGDFGDWPAHWFKFENLLTLSYITHG